MLEEIEELDEKKYLSAVNFNWLRLPLKAWTTPNLKSSFTLNNLTRDSRHGDGIFVGEIVVLNVLRRDDHWRHPAEVRRRFRAADLTLLLRRHHWRHRLRHGVNDSRLVDGLETFRDWLECFLMLLKTLRGLSWHLVEGCDYHDCCNYNDWNNSSNAAGWKKTPWWAKKLFWPLTSEP